MREAGHPREHRVRGEAPRRWTSGQACSVRVDGFVHKAVLLQSGDASLGPALHPEAEPAAGPGGHRCRRGSHRSPRPAPRVPGVASPALH